MYSRKRFTISATTDWTEQNVILPSKIFLKRIRAVCDSPGTQVALSFREKSGDDDLLSIPLEYSLVDSPLDSEEDIYSEGYRAKESTTATYWIAVKSDVDCNVNVLIEYEG